MSGQALFFPLQTEFHFDLKRSCLRSGREAAAQTAAARYMKKPLRGSKKRHSLRPRDDVYRHMGVKSVTFYAHVAVFHIFVYIFEIWQAPARPPRAKRL